MDWASKNPHPQLTTQFERTVAYYDQHADEFAAGALPRDMSQFQGPFLARIPDGGRILDAGCGPGRDSREFARRGYAVTAIDASRSMVELCRRHAGVAATQRRLEAIDDVCVYDGIWARASLLHLPKRVLPDVVARLHRALKPCGVLYMSFREGTCESQISGRLYNNTTAPELRRVLLGQGFAIDRVWTAPDPRKQPDLPDWVHGLACRPQPAAFAALPRTRASCLCP